MPIIHVLTGLDDIAEAAASKHLRGKKREGKGKGKGKFEVKLEVVHNQKMMVPIQVQLSSVKSSFPPEVRLWDP